MEARESKLVLGRYVFELNELRMALHLGGAIGIIAHPFCARFTASGANCHIIHLLLISSRSGPPKPATMKPSWLDDAIVACILVRLASFSLARPLGGPPRWSLSL